MVAQPRARQAIPVHGQGQRAVPHGRLPLLADWYQGQLDYAQHHLDNRVFKL